MHAAEQTKGQAAKSRIGREWTRRRKIGRRKVARSIKAADIHDLEAMWHFARAIGLPLNRFISIKPHSINDIDVEERIRLWSSFRNKLAQFARDNEFDFTCIWTRESEVDTGRNEHLHVLMHVPPHLHTRFSKVVLGWAQYTSEIDCRPANYRVGRSRAGKLRSSFTYITKNSPQAAHNTMRSYQKGGPILGKRFGSSSNLSARARTSADVRGQLQRDLGLPLRRERTKARTHIKAKLIFETKNGQND
jgi:hypothetical protein